MLEAFQREAVEVDEVAGDVKLGDLPLAPAQVPRSPHPAFEEERADLQFLALLDEQLVGPDFRISLIAPPITASSAGLMESGLRSFSR
jgi:hypothetical protein